MSRIMAKTIRYYLLTFLLAATTTAFGEEEQYSQDSVLEDAADFFGAGTKGLGDVVEKIFADHGRPNAVIKGEEASGALAVGARYGSGTLYMKSGSRQEVHWTGPSIGFDAGANASKVYVLVYHLPNADALFHRYPAIDGSLYFIGGISVNYHQSDKIILAPMRLGAGLRAGVNVGYMKYTREKTWNPF